MRPTRALVIYILFVFLGGALLAPWLWHLAQLFAGEFPKMARAPFHRFLDRAFLILALAGIPPLMRSLGAISWREAGVIPPYGQMKKLGAGILLGLFSLALVVAIEILGNARHFNPAATAGQIAAAIFSALVTAIVVGTLEEVLFRGAVFGGLRRALGWPLALAVSSLIFAFVHFLRPADIGGPVAWNSGLILLPRLFDLHSFFPAFLSLTLVGAILALGYQRTGNLYFPIGLHAGWVFVLRFFDKLTVSSATTSPTFWGTGTMVDGWLTFLTLGVLLLVFKFLPLERRIPHAIR